MTKCTNGQHSLVEILDSDDGYGSELVARWCEYCGGVVVDQDYDGRTEPGAFMKMKFPRIALDLVQE